MSRNENTVNDESFGLSLMHVRGWSTGRAILNKGTSGVDPPENRLLYFRGVRCVPL